jgi:arylsulfatase A-like enzyme
MVCSVSRSSFMTGMYATSIGAQNHRTKNKQMLPFLAYNDYKTQQYPVWTLWPKLAAEGKLTPAQQFAVQPTMPEEELYDMDSDPWQLTNLAKSDKPEVKATLTRMRAVLEKWITDTDDHGSHMETLEELQAADPKFTPARDWRPQPGTPDAAKDQPAPAEAPATKRNKAQE